MGAFEGRCTILMEFYGAMCSVQIFKIAMGVKVEVSRLLYGQNTNIEGSTRGFALAFLIGRC